ncbi:outer membrane protein assembly factor BamA [Erythrobacteraceae bacterium CFH 75059]|uniref:outer membrane protein assembly factor BamA n=1 Tax=Qipengyuania thermophila TaxID=2509361 RepID=UPI0010203600|nr:outer membrane protein assembly factor BamA [Qipengyuania thermophila]TCD05020.1 outer membrane protein assembly factor BamA [Erythrobacteraceae bacterium CFH 75059]
MSRISGSCAANRRVGGLVLLLSGTALAGLPAAAAAQQQQPVPSDGAAAQQQQQAGTAVQAQGEIIRSITVTGAQRLEPQTILSYIRLRVGEPYSAAAADQALSDLSATELFSDFSIRNVNGDVTINVVENPVINRIILEGNRRIRDDKILPEIRLAPRQIFTRSRVRADVARIIELYKRQGRFAASVEPKLVQLSQNRVDIVFEIDEGPRSRVRQINILGNERFSDSTLRGEMLTRQARLTSFLSSNTTYDPDRLAFDQQKLRQFYLTQGYADFRVVSAVAELTPDRRDFIITYVVEEGERYRFGDVRVNSELRDFDSAALASGLPMKSGDWYNAQLVENTVEQLTDTAGAFGYAFADVTPRFQRNPETRTMNVEFNIRNAPRVYVERIDVNGNTLTQDKVIRREFRLAEGDAFNSLALARTTARINSLGFFQENFEVTRVDGSAPDRIVLEANVEEQATGQLQLSAGFSSIENFILAGSIQQRNFRGRGQTLGLSVNWSRFSRSAQASFTEPYLFDRQISAGFDIYRRDLNSFNFLNNARNTTFQQTTTGLSGRVGVPLSEYSSLIGSYTLRRDDVTLDESIYFLDVDGDGIATCEPLLSSRFLCDAIGSFTSSIVGLTLNYSTLNSALRPTAGRSMQITGEYAGLGGTEKYFRLRGRAAQYFNIGGGFIFSLSAEGGVIKALQERPGLGVDDVRLTDRFFVGEGQIRGFDIRGIGPRVLRQPIDPATGEIITDRNRVQDDALGGNAFYIGRAELEIPLGSGARELGLRPSVFVDVGALFNVADPPLISAPNGVAIYAQTVNGVTTQTTSPVAPDGTPNVLVREIGAFREVFLGDTASPRISVGVGVNWNSPFGPFRIDFAKVLKSAEGDDLKAFSFNVGTQF